MSKNTNTVTDPDMEIILAEPPARRRGGGARSGKWQKKLDIIRNQHPNKSCLFAQGRKSAAYFYNLSAKHEDVTITTRQQEDGTFDVYVTVNA